MSAPDGRQNGAGWRILITGTGGQGVLTAARLLCGAFVERGRTVVSGQLHGMAQRGGSVQSSVIIDGGPSPVIGSGRADCVVGFEPVETARALPFMSPQTVVLMNTSRVIPFILGQRYVLKEDGADYPDVGRLIERIQIVTRKTSAFDATACAAEAGSAGMLNVLMLGCLMGTGLLPCTAGEFWSTVVRTRPPAFGESNAKAFHSGVELGKRLELGGHER